MTRVESENTPVLFAELPVFDGRHYPASGRASDYAVLRLAIYSQ